MRLHRTFLISWILLNFFPAYGMREQESPHAEWLEGVETLSLSEVEELLGKLDEELNGLARYALRTSVGAIGYKSQEYETPTQEEWIRIDLGGEHEVDQVILTPMLWEDYQTTVRSEGFPISFQLIVGTGEEEHTVATFTEKDHLTPRIAPFSISFPRRKASWVKIRATELSPLIGGYPFSLEFSEIFVFKNGENVALRRPVMVKEARSFRGEVQYLTDGHTPFLMDAASGVRSKSEYILLSKDSSKPVTLTLDLGERLPLHQVNFHKAHTILSLPRHDYDTQSVPRHVRVTGASLEDFSDEQFLCEYEQKSIMDHGPIMSCPVEGVLCRYIRLHIVDHSSVDAIYQGDFFSFSEVEVLSNNRNVALQKNFISDGSIKSHSSVLKLLTDGKNYFGDILPINVWMNQLARRHDLERVRPALVAELDQRYADQKKLLRRSGWIIALLAVVGTAFFLLNRGFRIRELREMKERIAADLHDGLGANLHSIGLFSDLAKQCPDNPTEQEEYLKEIRTITERSGHVLRSVTEMQSGEGLYEGLDLDMKRLSERMLIHLEHELTIEGRGELGKLPPRLHTDLYLFYKECLINACRHSDATWLRTHLDANNSERITLQISDNGKGIPKTISTGVPNSLQRRARLMKAELKVKNREEGGTQITLTTQRKKWWLK